MIEWAFTERVFSLLKHPVFSPSIPVEGEEVISSCEEIGKRGVKAVAFVIICLVSPVFIFFDLLYSLGKSLFFFIEGARREKSIETQQGVPMTEGNILSFYRDGLPNFNHVTWEQILQWDDEKLEQLHDFIQWLFPSRKRSQAVSGAPILDEATISAFRTSPALQQKLILSFKRMLHFYGLTLDETTMQISRTASFSERARVWLYNPIGHHNFLRITRILGSLKALGCEPYAKAFYAVLLDISQNEGRPHIPSRSLSYWKGSIVP